MTISQYRVSDSRLHWTRATDRTRYRTSTRIRTHRRTERISQCRYGDSHWNHLCCVERDQYQSPLYHPYQRSEVTGLYRKECSDSIRSTVYDNTTIASHTPTRCGIDHSRGRRGDPDIYCYWHHSTTCDDRTDSQRHYRDQNDTPKWH
jgi:hypothetical protein